MDASELAIQTTMTEAFILADAEQVVFSRRTKLVDGSGGFTFTTAPLANAQTVRLIPASDKVTEVITQDGQRARPQYTLIGMPTLDIKKYDLFTWRGSTWEVVEVHMKPDYEKKGDVILYVGG